MVILEAMMLGKPVIATPVGAVSDMLQFDSSEPCGVCVPVGDVSALRRAICCLVDRRGFASELGRRSRARVMQAYSSEAVYAMYRAVWTAV